MDVSDNRDLVPAQVWECALKLQHGVVGAPLVCFYLLVRICRKKIVAHFHDYSINEIGKPLVITFKKLILKSFFSRLSLNLHEKMR